MTVGRNEPCPCGSGLKYKNCCEGKRRASKGMLALIFVMAVIAGAGAMAAFMGRGEPPATPRPTAASPQAGRPQPGPAPPGKVWSVEHGHWHDAATGQQSSAPIRANVPPQNVPPQNVPAQTAPSQPVPQPAGTPPPGKVWSPEHGHWHDAPK